MIFVKNMQKMEKKMIFLSYNHADERIVEEIAKRLEKTCGRDNIFYDKWLIQPGDSIIEKMNSALEKCEHFFFFVTENSLKSKMVNLEWENALMRKSPKMKIIPVRMGNVKLPAILQNVLYIDLYTHGLEIALRQMVDVINEQNTYSPEQIFSNLIAYATNKDNEIILGIQAQYYMEPHSNYLLLVDNQQWEISWSIPYFCTQSSGFLENLHLGNGEIHNGIHIEINTATSPGFPSIIPLKQLTNTRINLVAVMHAVSRNNFNSIPLIINREKKCD